MRQIFWTDGGLGSMDEDLEIKEKFTKRAAYEVCDYAVHFGICGERKGTRSTLPFIRNIVWSCSAEGPGEDCAKSFALSVDVSRCNFIDSPKLDVTHNTEREHPNKGFDIVGCLVHDAPSALLVQDFPGHELGRSLLNAFSLKKRSDPRVNSLSYLHPV